MPQEVASPAIGLGRQTARRSSQATVAGPPLRPVSLVRPKGQAVLLDGIVPHRRLHVRPTARLLGRPSGLRVDEVAAAGPVPTNRNNIIRYKARGPVAQTLVSCPKFPRRTPVPPKDKQVDNVQVDVVEPRLVTRPQAVTIPAPLLGYKLTLPYPDRLARLP